MAMDSCLQNSSDQFCKHCTIDRDIDAICNHITCGNIVYDKKRLFWWIISQKQINNISTQSPSNHDKETTNN